MCLKQQLIDLNKEGYSDTFMDQLQPHIKISDWWAFTQTFISCYRILDGGFHILCDTFLWMTCPSWSHVPYAGIVVGSIDRSNTNQVLRWKPSLFIGTLLFNVCLVQVFPMLYFWKWVSDLCGVAWPEEKNHQNLSAWESCTFIYKQWAVVSSE